MEAIKSYLDSLFVKLPDTEETRNAKASLGKKMEARFQELLSQGKVESEAIAIVIHEFSPQSTTSEAEESACDTEAEHTYKSNPYSANNNTNPYSSAGEFGDKHDRRHRSPTSGNKTLDTIMSIYWPTITCVYLCWSFLTFAWYMTWIIWPIAGVVSGLIHSIFFIKEEK